MSKLNIVKTLNNIKSYLSRDVKSVISAIVLATVVLFLLAVFPPANAQEHDSLFVDVYPSFNVVSTVQPKDDVVDEYSTKSIDLIEKSVETQISAQSIIEEEPVITTTTTTLPSVPPYKSKSPEWICPQWHQTALDVGWPQDQLSKLSYVIYRESRCNPDSHNPDDPMGGSNGLVQINQFWCKPSRYWPDGWLQSHGVLTSCDQLFDPETNLYAALMIWYNSGWSPWGMSNK